MRNDLIKVEDEDGLFRDPTNQAILFRDVREGYERRRMIIESHEKDINNLKCQVSEIQGNVAKILDILTELKGRP